MKRDKNLDNSIKDGVAHSVMTGAGDTYVSAYAIELGATDKQIGLLASIPQLLGSISQLFSTNMTEKIGSRKRTVVLFALFQSLLWIPMTYLIFTQSFPVWKLIFLFTFYVAFSSIISPAWSSWVGDLVPDDDKGKFFGKRNMYNGIALFLSVLFAGLILSSASQYSPFLGFGIIFGVAFISKLISWNYLRKVEEPEFEVPEESKFSFIEFLKRMPETNFGKFVIFISFMTLSVQIAAPFFALYMLKDLGFSYWTYTLITSANKIANFVFISIWGKSSDLFGNRKVMGVTGYLIPLIPILWLFSTNPLYLIFIQVFSGFLWSGFNVSTFSFIFDTVSPQKRVRAVSYSNVLNGLSIFLGATLGGFLMDFGNMFWSSFILLLIISGLARFLASFVMLPKIKEVRNVEEVTEPKLLMNVVSGTFEGLKYPVLFLSDKRISIKKKGKDFLEWVRGLIRNSVDNPE